jgi:type 1 glutamine amidotransferase
MLKRLHGLCQWLLISGVALASVCLSSAANYGAQQPKERDIFDYEAHKAAKDVKRIVFVADTAAHGKRGNHEFLAAAILMARTINANYPNVYCAVHTFSKWPKDLKHADAIVVILNHGGSAVNPAVKEAMERGAGFMAVHWGIEVDKGEQADNYLKWLGGYFEPYFSVNPVWTANFTEIPKHEITRGVKPFSINDEWYYHMRFVAKMENVTPILYDLPPLKTIQDEGKKTTLRGGNPDVYADVKAGNKQVVAWAYNRPGGARAFGFSGLHFHKNLENDDFRTLLLNAVAWTAKLDVPANGVPSQKLSRQDAEQLIDDGLLAIKTRGIDEPKKGK